MTQPSTAAGVRLVNGLVGRTSTGDGSERKLHTLARILSKKIKTGQRKREEREGKQGYVGPNDYTHVIWQCMQQTTDNSFDDYLDRVEHALMAEAGKSKMKRQAWTLWFVLSCLQLIRDKRRGGRKRLPARGAKLANLIVNGLLISDGMAAMGVYDALAEQCHKLRQASECSAEDINRLGGLVSEDLRGEIHAPLDHSWLPLPGVLLSSLFNEVPYEDICEEIGLSHLDHLHFTSLRSNRPVVVGLEMSGIRKEWDALSVLSTTSGQANPHSTSSCEACPDLNTAWLVGDLDDFLG